MTATELTESTERGVLSGKSISVFSVLSVAESYKKQMRFSIINHSALNFETQITQIDSGCENQCNL